jgi:LPXTG-motif cell wall-anchored protein
MKLFKTAPIAACLALMGAAFSPSAKADDWSRKTVVTFSAPVEIPGVHLVGWSVLPAGTYVFKILDSRSDRHIVQIFSADELTVYATILAIPNYRLKATDKTVMTFRERPRGQPEALRAWFYPGRNWGDEFVYGKAMAIELAKSTNTPVLFTSAEIPAEVATPVRSAAEPVVAVLVQAPILAIKPSGEEVQIAEVVTAPPAEVAATTVQEVPATPVTPTIATLPDTASNVPMIALLGLVALGGAMIVAFIRKKAV